MSAATDTARRTLRDAPNLIESLVHYLHLAVVQRNEADTRTVENVVCILRNLSYRLALFLYSLYEFIYNSPNLLSE